MPSTYTNLGIELIGDGEKSNTWGAVTNTNWQMTEDALSGKHLITLSDQDTTIATYTNATSGSGNETRKFFLQFSGTLTTDRTITLPSKDKIYGIENKTTGGYSLIFTCGAGDNVTITNNNSAIVHTAVSGGHCVNLTNSTSSAITDAIAKIPSSWTNSVQSILGLTDTPSALGTQGQVLKVNSGGTALEFADDDAGSGSGGDAATLNGQQPSYYLNYNNFSNTPNLSGYLTSGSLSGYATASATPQNYVDNLNFNQNQIKNGTYVFAAVSPASTTTYSYGDTISGGNLLPTGAITTWGTSVTNQAMNSSSTLPGNWRCMGQRQPHPSNTYAWTINLATLWIKVSG